MAFYISLWKAAPFAIVPLLTATVYAFISYGIGIGAVFSSISISIAILAIIGWCRTKTIDDEVARFRLDAEQANRDYIRRMAKVESEFLKYQSYSNYLHLENIPFDERIYQYKSADYRFTFIPDLIQDMEYSDPDLIGLMDSYDTKRNEYLVQLKSFYEQGHLAILELDKALKVNQEKQPPERMPSYLKGLFYVLSEIVNSISEIDHPRDSITITNPEKHFIQLSFGKENASNPYPRLLSNDILKTIAIAANNLRIEAINLEVTIKHTNQVIFGESGSYRAGL